MLKKLFIFLIKFYRKYLSPMKTTKCPYYPTCSCYSLEAVQKYGAIKGSWLGMKIPFLCDHPMTIFIMPAGGFFVLGCLIALVNKIAGRKPPKEISCEGCPNAAACKGQCKVEEGA